MENIVKLVKTDLELVDKSLNSLFDIENDIFKELNLFLNSPKKRIRSLLTSLYLKTFSKEINVELLCIAELIHNASLLHDDVIDEARFRRDNETLACKFNSHVSILSGDFLLSLATEKLIKLENWQIISNFQHCIKKMSEAEILQYSLRGTVPEKEMYLQIIKGKTAELFVATLKSSALLAGLDVQKASRFAENFGILFQLKNDLEKTSAEADDKNKIHTLKDILGIEKTKALMDNYLEELRTDIRELPQNVCSKGLEELLRLI